MHSTLVMFMGWVVEEKFLGKKKKPLSKPNNYLTQSLIDNLIILCYQIGHEGTMLGIDYCH